MKEYRRKKWGFILFLGAIVIIGYLALLRPPSYEIFPFYSWSMFSMVPNQHDEYAIFILEEQGKSYSPPVEFQNAAGLVRNPNSVVAFRDIQNMGISFTTGEMEQFEGLRKVFERNYLEPGTRYRLMRTNSDPLTRWKTGSRRVEPLKEFNYGR